MADSITVHRALVLVAIAGSIIVVGCDRRTAPQPADSTAARPRAGGASPVAFHVPDDSAIPKGPEGMAVRRGRALLLATRDSLPQFVGAALRCTSCHLDGGVRPNALPLVGVYARFPQYRARSARVELIEDRVNDCFLRSMNGRALDRDGRDMHDIVAYLAFISRGVPVGAQVRGTGTPRLASMVGDSVRGRAMFASTCSRCHGADGGGTALAPPVAGPGSFNIGAGMTRLNTMAPFIRANMPYDHAVTLTDQQAFDIASFVGTRPRPDFPGKEHDWPNGDAPADAPYHPGR